MVCEECKNEKRIKDIEDNIIKCMLNDAVTSERYQTILKSMTKMESDIADIKSTPRKRWDAVITGLITGIVGLLIGLISSGVIGR